MRAEARVVAEADGRGGTRLSTVYGEPPLLPRRTGHRHAGHAEVHLVGGAAGPLGGDELRIHVEVGPDAHLVVRTVAASLAQPSHPPRHSTLTITATVHGTLAWLPEPTVAVTGCDHTTRSIVDLCDGAELLWREELIAGRHDEPSGDLRAATTVRCGGRTILRHDLAIGPSADAGPATVGGARAVGTLLVVGPHAPTRPTATSTGATMPLANAPAALISATASDAAGLRRALDGDTVNTWAADPSAKPGNCRKN
ncbi:urease accessory protein UreD [Asanoa iriomotensis]|uniref:Urease accessory protein UreD n=1 Tax=Asanoa iriomotensis TaxID=234613 RepID=A0ABQ4C2F0_9ACTN|nr:urease accessory protein UreD [Asanoa iriomotensis]GIF56971.1 urease accessory protein UreD [Asanoa iriomotensis]